MPALWPDWLERKRNTEVETERGTAHTVLTDPVNGRQECVSFRQQKFAVCQFANAQILLRILAAAALVNRLKPCDNGQNRIADRTKRR